MQYTGTQAILGTLSAIYWTSMPPISQYNSYYWTSMPIISQSKAYDLTSMSIISRYNSYYWTSMPVISQNIPIIGPQCPLLGAAFAKEHILGTCSWKHDVFPCSFLGATFAKEHILGTCSCMKKWRRRRRRRADNFSSWQDPLAIACRDEISRSGIPHFVKRDGVLKGMEALFK